MPLQQINSEHLAALESEIANLRASEKDAWIKMQAARLDAAVLRAQRDTLRDACLQFVAKSGNSHVWNAVELDLCRKIARNALQACQD